MEPPSSSSMTIYPTTSTITEPLSATTTDTASNYIRASTTYSIATSDTTSLPPVMEPHSSSMTIYPTAAIVPTDSITTASISITSSLSTTIISTPGQGNAGIGTFTILIIAVIALLVVTLIVIMIVSVRVFRKKRKLSLPVSSSTMNDNTNNHVYINVGSTGNDKGTLCAVNYPSYELQGISILRAFIVNNVLLLLTQLYMMHE